MDLSRVVGYRGFALNTIKFDAVTRDMVGCEITSVEYGSVQGVGYDEKRALADGFDKSDVFLGKRLVALAGNIYGRTRAEAFDLFRQFTDLMTPTDAYEANKGQRGYLPLDFYVPTAAVTTFPSGLIHQVMHVRPLATPSARFDTDRSGGQDNQALAIPWTAQLDARLPYIVNYDYTSVPLHAAINGSGNLVNRGNRPAVLEIVLVIPADFNGTTANGRFDLSNAGGGTLSITIPRSAAAQTIRYDSHAKVLTRDGGLRMDLLVHKVGHTHTNLPAGSWAYSWARIGTKNLLNGSYIRFRDTWA